MEKRGINETELDNIQNTIDGLGDDIRDSSGLTKSAGGNLDIRVTGWTDTTVTIGIFEQEENIWTYTYDRSIFQ